MAAVIDFIFDFASPNGYLVRRPLAEIAARTGAQIHVVPCLLGGIFKAAGNQAPMVAFAGVKGKMAYEMLETERFVARHALYAFKMNPHFPVNSLLAIRGLVAAERDGVAEPYLDAVSSGFWEQGLKMDDPAVVQSCLTQAGLDGPGLLAKAQDPAVKAALAANTEAAVARGAFGVPTFFVGEEMFFGKERLGQVEAEAAKAA